MIATRDRPEALRECLRSIASLDPPEDGFEVIVVDDGSLRPIEDVLFPFRSELAIRSIRQPNAGPAAARNAGARVASGRTLAFTDDDCRPARDWLRVFEARLAGSPQAAIAGRKVNALTRNVFSCASQAISDVAYAHFNVRPGHAGFVSTSNLALSAQGFREIGGFDPSFRCAEDRDLGTRWRALGRPLHYEAAAIVHHAHPLTFRSLWRQHYGFGRGALRFHRKQATAGAGGLRPDPRFYARLVLEPFRQSALPRSILVLACLALAQLANLAGYVRESFERSAS